MPTSPHDQPPGVDDVRTYLETIPDSEVTTENIDPSYSPLVFMHRINLLAAFGFANGNLRNSYERLYSGFKAQYNSYRDKWADLDLAFIFCVRPDSPDLDLFCSHVETDVFFCRKFVVPLAHPLDAAFARLPFLPLARVHGTPSRPPSAQTLLQQCGVPAELSRFIVVQRERSPEGIVEDCVSGRFGEPTELRLKSIAPIASLDSIAPPVRATSLTIKNFRAYRQEQTFNLDADVTVLYGPNGFGKTSVFDAIDFAITGGISRFESSTDSRFVRTARHLDSEAEECVVSLSVAQGDAVSKITRTIGDRKSAHINGQTADRKEVLSELTKATIPTADRIENFVRLFRATHLFSQENQELAKDFDKTCALSEQVVSRMLAFEDYLSAVNKAARVLEIIRREGANAEQEALALSSQLSDDKNELTRLQPIDATQSAATSLQLELPSLQKKLRDVGISEFKKDPDISTVRGWRASIEARRADSKSRIERLSSLAGEAGNLPGMQRQIASRQQEIASFDQTIAKSEHERSVEETAMDTRNTESTALTTRRTELQKRAVTLEWVRTIKPDYAKRLAAYTEATKMMESAATRHLQSAGEEARLAIELEPREAEVSEIERRMDRKGAELAYVMALCKSADLFRLQQEQLAHIATQERTAQNELEQLRIESLDLSEKSSANADAGVRLSAQIAGVDRTQSELRNMFSQLQGFIHDNSCPLCGHGYKSRDELIETINAHIAADEATSARAELLEVQAVAKQLATRLDAVKRRQQQLERFASQLANSKASLSADLERFRDAASSFGISRDITGQTVIERLEVQRDLIQTETDKLQEEANTVGTNLRGVQAKVAEQKPRTVADAAALVEARKLHARCLRELEVLTKDPRLTTVPIDIDHVQLDELIRSNSETLLNIGTDIAKADEYVAQQRAKIAQHRQKVTSLRAQLSTAQSELAKIQAALAGIAARFAEAGLEPDTNTEALNKLIDQESYKHAQLLSLRDSIANIEVAIDAATTSAAHMRLLQEVRNKESRIESAKDRRKRHEPWAKYFDQLSRLMSSHQNEAIAAFTRQYGPRASVLQQRLRSVYGFEEIEIVSRQSEIDVRVKRHGERLRPTDYFSQSQQQTLLLGLFLTACLSQTWSCLAPVFLDDPVTHFDDLNSYSFLDLILGLLESPFAQHQFVISTCDEKILDLARQKFRHIGKRARFYVFSAVGSDGPIVDEIA